MWLIIDTLLIAPAIRPFQRTAVEKLKATHLSGIENDPFEISVSSGESYPDILVTVSSLRGNTDFCKFNKIMTDSCKKRPSFVTFETRALGIPLQVSTEEIQRKLSSHVEDIVKDKRNYGEVLYDDTSQLAWDIYEAIWTYAWSIPEVISFLARNPLSFANPKTRTNFSTSSCVSTLCSTL